MKLLNWGFGSFDLRVRTDTPIVSIKRQLVDRHGRMADLRLFIGQPTGREIQGKHAFVATHRMIYVGKLSTRR